MSSCDGFGICDLIISTALVKPEPGLALGSVSFSGINTFQIKIDKEKGITPENLQKYFSSGYFLLENDFMISSQVGEQLGINPGSKLKNGRYKVQEVNGILILELGGGLIFNHLETAEQELKNKRKTLDSLIKEKEEIGKKIRDTAAAKRDCEEELKKAEAELAAAEAQLQKQKDVNKNIENNTGPGKYWPDKEAAQKAHGDFEQKLKDAQAAVGDAQAKVNKLRKRCPDLTKALESLKSKEKSLPGEIESGGKAVTEAEARRDEMIKDSKKCKEGEIRDAPGKSSTSSNYLCATSDTKIDVVITTNLDGTLNASKDFSDYIKVGLIILKKVPVIGKMIKIASLPAKMGADILAAIPNSGALSRIGLSSVGVDITIGPLHKFTLTKSDLEICKNGVWVPYDKKKCVLKDEGEVPSTPKSHTWKIGGVAGSDLSELTSAGTGFKEALAAEIEKLITDAVTEPAELEGEMKDCQ